MKWYQREVEDILRKLETSVKGLTEAEAADRIQKYGPNKLAEEGQISRLKLLLHQFTSPLIYILMIAAVVTFFLQEYKDTGVIVAVILLNAVIGYSQELKAEKNVRALKKLIVPKARVIRDGRELEIDSEGLVPGDMVVLASGSKVPADLRLVKTMELRIDEAMLTGESLPAEKNPSNHPGRESDLGGSAQYGLYGDGGGQRPGQRGGGGNRAADGFGPDRHAGPGGFDLEGPPSGKV